MRTLSGARDRAPVLIEAASGDLAYARLPPPVVAGKSDTASRAVPVRASSSPTPCALRGGGRPAQSWHGTLLQDRAAVATVCRCVIRPPWRPGFYRPPGRRAWLRGKAVARGFAACKSAPGVVEVANLWMCFPLAWSAVVVGRTATNTSNLSRRRQLIVGRTFRGHAIRLCDRLRAFPWQLPFARSVVSVTMPSGSRGGTCTQT